MAKVTKPFSVNVSRFDPYKSYRFLVYLGPNPTPVAGVSKVGALKRSADVIEYKEGGNALIRKGLGRTKYDPITLERGVTHDQDFEQWANAAQVLDKPEYVRAAVRAVRTCLDRSRAFRRLLGARHPPLGYGGGHRARPGSGRRRH